MKKIPESIVVRREEFLYRIKKVESGCWEWQRSLTPAGYGRFRSKGSNKRIYYLAHRVSYAMFKQDPHGFLVMHKCDNPPCVNPDHLQLGTYSDNMQDCIKKDRLHKYEPFERATSITKDVFELAKQEYLKGKSVRSVAKLFDVQPSDLYNYFKKYSVPLHKHRSNLAKEEIEQIRQMLSQGIQTRIIAKTVGRSQAVVMNIKNMNNLKYQNLATQPTLEYNPR